MELTHSGYKCEVVFDLYADNKNTAIILLDKEDGEIVTFATTNIDHVTAEDVVGIKTWTENEGIVKSLVKGNVIQDELLYTIPTGYAEVEYYQLTEEAIQEVEDLKEEISRRSANQHEIKENTI